MPSKRLSIRLVWNSGRDLKRFKWVKIMDTLKQPVHLEFHINSTV